MTVQSMSTGRLMAVDGDSSLIVVGIEGWDRDNADGYARRDVGDVARKRRVERRDRDRRQDGFASVRRPKAINESASGGLVDRFIRFGLDPQAESRDDRNAPGRDDQSCPKPLAR